MKSLITLLLSMAIILVVVSYADVVKPASIIPITESTPDKKTPESSADSGSGGVVAESLEPSIDAEVDMDNGNTLVVTFKVKNQTERTEVLTFPSGQKFDFIVYDKEGNKVFQWSDEKSFIQMIQTVELKPGEELTFVEPTGLPPGDYKIEAWLTAEGKEDVRAETRIGVRVD